MPTNHRVWFEDCQRLQGRRAIASRAKPRIYARWGESGVACYRGATIASCWRKASISRWSEARLRRRSARVTSRGTSVVFMPATLRGRRQKSQQNPSSTGKLVLLARGPDLDPKHRFRHRGQLGLAGNSYPSADALQPTGSLARPAKDLTCSWVNRA